MGVSGCTGFYTCDGISVSRETWLVVHGGCHCEETFYGQQVCDCFGYSVSSTVVSAVQKGCNLPCSGGGLTLTGGKSDSDQGGHVLIAGGDSPGSDGPPVYMRGGASTASGKTGGRVGLVSGSSSSGTSGNVDIQSHGGNFAQKSGDIVVKSGESQLGSGNIHIQTGKSGSGGDITLVVGNSTQSDGGNVWVAGGNASAPSKGGGTVSIRSGGGSGGGALVLRAGMSTDDSKRGGNVLIDSGRNTEGGPHGNIVIGPSSPTIMVGPEQNFGTIHTNGLLKTHAVSIGRGENIAQVAAHRSFISATIRPSSISPSQVYSITLGVPGAKVGDVVSASYSKSLNGLMLSAAINSDNECTITLFNPGSGDSSVQLSPGKFRATVWQYN